MFCTNCGKELEAGDVFCVYCGARLEPVQSTEESPATPVPPVSGSTTVSQDTSTTLGTRPAVARKSPVGWIVAVVLLVVAGIVVLMYGNRTEYYNELTWGGGRKNIPVLAQKVKSAGTYEAEFKGNKLVRISGEQGNESMTWKINDAGTLEEVYQEGTEYCRERKVHAVKGIFDGAGNLTRQEYYGVDGRLKEDSAGLAIYESEYDSAGNITRGTTYGADGRLKEGINGFAIYEEEYDSAGNITRKAGYGADGRLKEDSAGLAIYEFEYDSAGNVTRGVTYGVDGHLKGHNEFGYAIYEREYDSAGNVVATRFYDADYKILYIF